MMHLRVLVATGHKNKDMLAALQEYGKRLGKYCKISLRCCTEGAALAKDLKSRGQTYTIAIPTAGPFRNVREMDSESFAETLESLAISGTSDVTFLVGPTGLPADTAIALSRMDTDPLLAAVVLYEQVYRAFRILNNHAYHK
ncbi:23S rRNA (pseudouridine(1915)-N(3))-methyltransferase RlmH [Anaerotalea alkaliphila]|uniref:23S rRNA (Pseudouridine(1915)-N(3))-methyltransferase RlmH n=1 Tax=Anaerotalea alkaliphila TaxID=2662126 RepID=A0A7X5HTU1_9FIRM|nr:23S rRNA (pseudouridine(1915)-N(3))-methyltransferase RlmH [Anaerotalea alkaliphila]NDL66555.1 23S rRNA (pseudouridine(1915)-N(3))-methyltransferase RlmH [Anaerotalea alkaliphila]